MGSLFIKSERERDGGREIERISEWVDETVWEVRSSEKAVYVGGDARAGVPAGEREGAVPQGAHPVGHGAHGGGAGRGARGGGGGAGGRGRAPRAAALRAARHQGPLRGAPPRQAHAGHRRQARASRQETLQG